MLYRAPIAELKRGRISRRVGYVAVVMQHFPRFTSKDLIDEYLRTLAPDRELFAEFKAQDRLLKDHDLAFAQVRYEERFSVSAPGRDDLTRLCELSKSRDVFLICQCAPMERCHADLLLLVAKHQFGARTQTPRREYPIFTARLQSGAL